VRFEIAESDPASYQAAADSLNSSNVDLVCLQQEYGIFGGKSGSHVLQLMQRLKAPVVTTPHKVLCKEPVPRRVNWGCHEKSRQSSRLELQIHLAETEKNAGS
jgi:hypothetical protein